MDLHLKVASSAWPHKEETTELAKAPPLRAIPVGRKMPSPRCISMRSSEEVVKYLTIERPEVAEMVANVD
jgi:hypothetical protein